MQILNAAVGFYTKLQSKVESVMLSRTQ